MLVSLSWLNPPIVPKFLLSTGAPRTASKVEPKTRLHILCATLLASCQENLLAWHKKSFCPGQAHRGLSHPADGVTVLQGKESNKKSIWFNFQKIKYIYDAEEKKQFSPVYFPLDLSIQHYQNCKGYQDDAELAQAKGKHGINMYVSSY